MVLLLDVRQLSSGEDGCSKAFKQVERVVSFIEFKLTLALYLPQGGLSEGGGSCVRWGSLGAPLPQRLPELGQNAGNGEEACRSVTHLTASQ